jgi:hypothetical protein
MSSAAAISASMATVAAASVHRSAGQSAQASGCVIQREINNRKSESWLFDRADVHTVNTCTAYTTISQNERIFKENIGFSISLLGFFLLFFALFLSFKVLFERTGL